MEMQAMQAVIHAIPETVQPRVNEGESAKHIASGLTKTENLTFQ